MEKERKPEWKIIMLTTKFLNGAKSLKHKTCCRWLREKSGLAKDDLLKILDVKVNLGPEKYVMIEFDESADVESISKRIRNTDIYDNVDAYVGLINDVKICEVQLNTSGFHAVTVYAKNQHAIMFDFEDSHDYFRKLFEDGVIVEYARERCHFRVVLVVPNGSIWLDKDRVRSSVGAWTVSTDLRFLK